MDFLDAKKRRAHMIRLFIGYGLVAIALFLTTWLMVFYAYGYNFSVSREADVEQKGLVFVSSQPSGAEIYLNTKRNKSTNAKLNIVSGSYTLELKKEGYHNWKRPIQVVGGDVHHFVYPMLFPAQLQPKTLVSYAAEPSLALQSPDRRWLIVQPADSDGAFDVYDLNRSPDTVKDAVKITVPRELLTAGTQVSWKLAEWSTDNRHVLLQRTFTANGQSQQEYIMVDRDTPTASRNLSQTYDLVGKTIALRDKKYDAYYIHDTTSGELRVATLDSTDEPAVVAEHVLSYKSYGADILLYATDQDAPEQNALIKLKDGDKTYRLRTVPHADVYVLDIARYKGSWYVAAGSQTSDRVFVYKDPVAQLQHKTRKQAYIAAALRISQPTQVSFSANTRFIAAQNGTKIALYDIEENTTHQYALPVPLDAPQKTATWMDGHRLTYVSGGEQTVFDYDGINRHELGVANATLQSYFDRDYIYLYTFAPAANGQAGLNLTATPLRTETDL